MISWMDQLQPNLGEGRCDGQCQGDGYGTCVR